MQCKLVTLHNVTTKCPKDIPAIRRIYRGSDIELQNLIKHPFDPIKQHNIFMDEIMKKNSEASYKAIRELTGIFPRNT